MTSSGYRLAALGVHVLTASGGVWALLALFAATRADWTAMFWWLGVAMLVDGIDGPLARRVSIRERQPRYDGTVLDLIVDYLTYVFVPAYALAVSGLVPDGLGFAAAGLVAVTSLFYFMDTRQKTDDNFFLGFPAVWNLVVFLLFALAPPPWLALLTVAAFSALTFAPLHFVHPVRVERGRAATLSVTAAASVLALVVLTYEFRQPALVSLLLTLVTAYLFGVGFLRSYRGR